MVFVSVMEEIFEIFPSAIGLRFPMWHKLMTDYHCMALQVMKESRTETVTTAPKVQKLERLQTIEKEHKDALERAVSLNIPHAVTPTEEQHDLEDQEEEVSHSQSEQTPEIQSKPSRGRANWDELVEKLMKKKGSGNPVTDANPPQ